MVGNDLLAANVSNDRKGSLEMHNALIESPRILKLENPGDLNVSILVACSTSVVIITSQSGLKTLQ